MLDSSHSPYRDPTESRIRNLEERLAKVERERSSMQVTLVQQKAIIASYELAVRIGRKYRRVKHTLLTTGLASLASFSMAIGFVMGALCMLPAHGTHDSFDHAVPVASRPTMQAAPTPQRIERVRLCLVEPPMHIIRFDGYHLTWVDAARKPDEYDLTFWLWQHEDQAVLVARLY